MNQQQRLFLIGVLSVSIIVMIGIAIWAIVSPTAPATTPPTTTPPSTIAGNTCGTGSDVVCSGMDAGMCCDGPVGGGICVQAASGACTCERAAFNSSCADPVSTPTTDDQQITPTEPDDDQSFVSGEAACGDGIAQTSAGEECDDGNATNGDGCNNSCQLENTTACNIIAAGVEYCQDGCFGTTGIQNLQATAAADSEIAFISNFLRDVRSPESQDFVDWSLYDTDVIFYFGFRSYPTSYLNKMHQAVLDGKHIVFVTDGCDNANYCNGINVFLSRYGLGVASNYEINSRQVPLEPTAELSADFSGISTIDVITNGNVVYGTSAADSNLVSSYACQYTVRYDSSHPCIWGQAEMTTGSKISIFSSGRSLFSRQITNALVSSYCADATPASVCGNGTIEAGEECDDGNTTSGDGCSSTCQITTECSDGIDNDGDGYIDCQVNNPDPGCFPDGNGGGGACNPDDDDEEDASPPECSDGIDNDGDGFIDCDATNPDPGCFPDGNGGGGECNPLDDNEEDGTRPICDDGLDNDGDGLIDCEDPGCHIGGDLDLACLPNRESEVNSLPATAIISDEADRIIAACLMLVMAIMAIRTGLINRLYTRTVLPILPVGLFSAGDAYVYQEHTNNQFERSIADRYRD